MTPARRATPGTDRTPPRATTRPAGRPATRTSRRRLLGAAGVLGVLLAARPRAVAPDVAAGAHIADVRAAESEDVLRFLAGEHEHYQGADLDTLFVCASANILEVCDVEVLDALGPRSLAALHDLIAVAVLETAREAFAGQTVVLALDAGHGGRRGVYFDPGAAGTEWWHTRAVASAIEEHAAHPRYDRIVTRRVDNDDLGDDFGVPGAYDCDGSALLTVRGVRTAMLAEQARRWNRAHPDEPVVVHLLSLHFNTGSGSMLVLHQGTGVPDDVQERSIVYAERFLEQGLATLNGSGLLPARLGRALGTGLSDDRLLYPSRPCYVVNPYTGVDTRLLPARYWMLLAAPAQRDFIEGVFRYRALLS